MNTSNKGCCAPDDSNYHSNPLVYEKYSSSEYGQDPGYGEFALDFEEFPSSADGCSSEGDVFEYLSGPRKEFSPDDEHEGKSESNYSSARMAVISRMLMEEEESCLLNESSALKAAEKSYYDILNNSGAHGDSPTSQIHGSSSEMGSLVESTTNQESLELNLSQLRGAATPAISSDLQWFNSSMSPIWSPDSLGLRWPEIQFNGSNEEYGSTNYFSRGKRNHQRGNGDHIQGLGRNKRFANSIDEFELSELSDEVLLCKKFGKLMPNSSEIDETEAYKQVHQGKQSRGSTRGRPKGSKNLGVVKEVVDLRSLLIQCAEAVASFDSRTVNDLLTKIRQHSSPHGDGTERVAHYFANAIEARLAGTGPASHPIHLISKRVSAAQKLKAYQMYLVACPFRKMSNIMANRTINKIAIGATTLHIIDFGILYGYQWPILIEALSEREGGPPKLRITGIDFPQPGFRPTERVEESGIWLKKYCEKFGVPFEYNGIAQKWETIKPEDLKIRKDELLVVNSLRFDNVLDETDVENSPRETVLNLIRKINPSIFVHGLMNGTYNTPFFVTRFREALFHFSSMFDILEATVNREDPQRMYFEKEVFGNDVMNIIACEGAERVYRPETYKQWQVRNKRAGFRQIPLDQELLEFVKYRVETNFNKDFFVDEDGKWILQGWKGRVIHALSLWRPSQK